MLISLVAILSTQRILSIGKQECQDCQYVTPRNFLSAFGHTLTMIYLRGVGEMARQLQALAVVPRGLSSASASGSSQLL